MAYRTFRTAGVRRLPVLEDHRVVGVLTVDDMLIDVFQGLADLLGPVGWSVLDRGTTRTCLRGHPPGSFIP
ncbi:CBS domain-containing protein [Streptomyces sp. NPDC004050]